MISVESKVLLSLSIYSPQRYRFPRKTNIPAAGNQPVQGPGTQILLSSWTSHCLQPRKEVYWGHKHNCAFRMTPWPFPFLPSRSWLPLWIQNGTQEQLIPFWKKPALGACFPWDLGHGCCRTKSVDSGVSLSRCETELWLSSPLGLKLSNGAE